MTELRHESPRPQTAPAHGPIFVDASGRRLRRVRIAGGIFLVLVVGYVALLAVALLGGPNIAAPYLPLPAQTTATADQGPAAPPWTGPSAAPAAGNEGTGLSAVLAAHTAAAPAGSGAVQAPAAPARPVAPSPSPTSPGKSGTAPGQSDRPHPHP
ncbi:hypothetical protein [Sinomonas sp. ASV322]|uniref:hypothetical protein n=1 Tax=Sinomonas sp. ASV322 TaxID=3041920 RepID=UPI0027DCF78C|nr:hypothetical protein [Sinomonas sp. ASV322]MDQ4503669.1 hypothetical protein [Sinomonas sp. ASV322]